MDRLSPHDRVTFFYPASVHFFSPQPPPPMFLLPPPQPARPYSRSYTRKLAFLPQSNHQPGSTTYMRGETRGDTRQRSTLAHALRIIRSVERAFRARLLCLLPRVWASRDAISLRLRRVNYPWANYLERIGVRPGPRGSLRRCVFAVSRPGSHRGENARFSTVRSVSLMGLPFIRTSVDHGTAFDIAGNGVARAG